MGEANPTIIVTSWTCKPCDVAGRDVGENVTCWNCGGEVTITAKPTIPCRGDAPCNMEDGS